MKDWIIISNYDSGTNFSITIDGITADKDCLTEWIKPLSKTMKRKLEKHIQIMDIIGVNHCGRFYDVANRFNKRLCRKIAVLYSRNIIVCEDGNIEIIKFKQYENNVIKRIEKLGNENIGLQRELEGYKGRIYDETAKPVKGFAPICFYPHKLVPFNVFSKKSDELFTPVPKTRPGPIKLFKNCQSLPNKTK